MISANHFMVVPQSHGPISFGAGIATMGCIFGDLNVLASHQIPHSFHAHRIGKNEPTFFYPIVNEPTSVTVSTGRGPLGARGGFEIPLVLMRKFGVKNYEHYRLLVAHYTQIIAKSEIPVNQNSLEF